MQVSYNVTDVSCNGANNGAIDLTVTGGTQPYTYEWNDAATSEDRTSLAADTYSVTVTDFNGLTATSGDITVSEPPIALSVSVSALTNVLCNGEDTGAISITVSGGTPDYTYSWTGSNGFSSYSENSIGFATITSLYADTYSVTVTDANGCTATSGDITVSEPAVALSVSVYQITNVLCNGENTGAISITVSGGTPDYTYSWTSPNGFSSTSKDITVLAAGTYSVTVTDGNGCTASSSITVSEPAVLSISYSKTDLCNGASNGAIDLTVTGGVSPYDYAWNDAATSEDRTGLAAGTYSVTVTDANGCTATSGDITVSETAVLSISYSKTDLLCNGANTGAISITVSGGTPDYTYSWTSPNGFSSTSKDITFLAAGTYSVTVTDGNGCTASSSITVSEPAVLTIGVVNVTNESSVGASDGTIDITISGGTLPYTYEWNDGSTIQNRTDLTASTYSVNVIDNNGCSIASGDIVVETNSITIVATDDTFTINGCLGGTTESVLANDTLDSQPATLDNVYLTWITDPAPTGFTLNGDGTIIVAPGTTAGNYTLTYQICEIANPDNCDTADATVTVYATTPIAGIINNSATTELNCTTSSILLTAYGGVSYSWSNGETSATITVITQGTYTVTVTDINGCTDTDSIEITQAPTLSISYTVTNVSCNGANNGEIDLTTVSGGTPPYTYSWSNGANTEDISGLAAGTYSVTVTDATDCTQTVSDIIVSEPPALSILYTVTNVSCNGANNGEIDLTTVSGGVPPYTYSWSNGANTEDISGLAAGTYTVTVTDTAGCALESDPIEVSEQPALSISYTVTGISSVGASNGSINITVTDGTGPFTYQWSNGATTEDISGLSAGDYYVTITDGNGCPKTFGPFKISVIIICFHPDSALIVERNGRQQWQTVSNLLLGDILTDDYNNRLTVTKLHVTSQTDTFVEINDKLWVTPAHLLKNLETGHITHSIKSVFPVVKKSCDHTYHIETDGTKNYHFIPVQLDENDENPEYAVEVWGKLHNLATQSN